mmetsp:Transcript_17028/g.47839  ORF Transcript_17028/g.47839 Transcript_17028/m.47839 type:complete len:80 (+) Transcript_17028:448-687(+)
MYRPRREHALSSMHDPSLMVTVNDEATYRPTESQDLTPTQLDSPTKTVFGLLVFPILKQAKLLEHDSVPTVMLSVASML